MKIRNKKTGAEYCSETLIKCDKLDVKHNLFFDCAIDLHTFHFVDGWEEVKKKCTTQEIKNETLLNGESHELEKEDSTWHDLRKNAKDLPPLEFEGSNKSVEVYVCTKQGSYNIACYDYIEKYWVSNGVLFTVGYDTKDLSAWRELPQFNGK